MIRKQLYIPGDLNRRLNLAAKQQQKTEAQLIRELLEAGLTQQKSEMTAADALLGLAELGKKLGLKAEPDFSSKIDDFLYGDDDH